MRCNFKRAHFGKQPRRSDVGCGKTCAMSTAGGHATSNCRTRLRKHARTHSAKRPSSNPTVVGGEPYSNSSTGDRVSAPGGRYTGANQGELSPHQMIRLAPLYAVAYPSTGRSPRPPAPAIPPKHIARRALPPAKTRSPLIFPFLNTRVRGVATDQVRGRHRTPKIG